MPAGNEISVTVNNGTAVGVAVSGATGDALYVTNGATASIAVTSVGDRGPKGDIGLSNTISVGTVTTSAAGSSASASMTGVSPNQSLNLVLPRGNTGPQGPAATVAVGDVSTAAAGAAASVTNSGTSGAAVLDFVIPRGNTGETGPPNSLTVGTVTTGAAGSSAAASITGAPPNQTLSMTIPRGDVGPVGPTGPAGPANTLTIGTVSSVPPGDEASASIEGTAPNQTLNLIIPRGARGADGSDVEFQASATHIQWRYAGDEEWLDLVPLTAILGPPNSLSIGTVTASAAGSAAAASITGAAPSQTLNLTLPRGVAGPANQLTIGTVTTGAPGSSAQASVSGLPPLQSLNLIIPRGSVGEEGPPGPAVELRNSGTHIQWKYTSGSIWANLAALADITGAAGATGAPGAAATVSVGTVTTGAPGTSASVTNSGTSSAAVLDFTIPRGATGAAAATVSVGTVTTGAPGTSASVTNSGTSSEVVLDFTIPRGATGATGSGGGSETFGTPQGIVAVNPAFSSSPTPAVAYNPAPGDEGKLLLVNASSPVIILVQEDTYAAFPVGTHIDIASIGTGAVQVDGDTSVTVNATPGRKLRARYSTATLIKYAANTWLLVGDIST